MAAHLSLGVPLTSLGPALPDPVRLAVPDPVWGEAEVAGEIIAGDHFGNLISNIPFDLLHSRLRGRRASLRVKGQVIEQFATTYSEVPPARYWPWAAATVTWKLPAGREAQAQVLGAAPGDRVQVSLSSPNER